MKIAVVLWVTAYVLMTVEMARWAWMDGYKVMSVSFALVTVAVVIVVGNAFKNKDL